MLSRRIFFCIKGTIVLVNLLASSNGYLPAKTCVKPSSAANKAFAQIRGDVDGEKSRSISRRNVFQHTAAGIIPTIASLSSAPANAASASPYLIPTPPFSTDTYWPLGKIAFSLLPLAGGTRRATVEQCIVPDTMWTFDQIQGIVNVNVPVRQTVIRLSEESGGGLWVHNPVAPTPQLLKRVKELEARYGAVRHIVLGSVGLEHKSTLGPFSRRFPSATVWVQPGQWSFPVQFPLELLGVSQRRPFGTLRDLPPQTAANPPEWTKDIDYEILGPFKFKSVGAFSETAFYHKSSQSLLTTDVVISVTEEPPAIIQEDPRALLFHSRDSAGDATLLATGDTPELRRKGWRRMVQFGLIFLPSQIEVPSFQEDTEDAKEVPKQLRNLGQGAVPLNLYPWRWKGDADIQNFRAISNNGALFCPPILTKLILDRETQSTLEWVDHVASRFPDMKRIVPCHLNNDVKATVKDFSQAFDSLRCTSNSPKGALRDDLKLLQEASDLLTRFGIVAPTELECKRINI